MTVRAGTNWPGEEQHQLFTVNEIERVTIALSDLEIELYNIQRAIEERDSSPLHTEVTE